MIRGVRELTRHKTNPFPPNEQLGSHPSATIELMAEVSRPAAKLFKTALDTVDLNTGLATLDPGVMTTTSYYKAVLELANKHAIAIGQLPFVYVNFRYVPTNR
jgi:hypothetical protein